MTVPVNVGGVLGQYNFDLTSSATQLIFQQAVDQIISVSGQTGTPSFEDLSTFNTAVNNLKRLAQGINPNTQAPLETPITANMAGVVNSLISILSGFEGGVTLQNNLGLGSLTQFELWKNVYYQGLQSVLFSFSSVSLTSTRTLQSYVNIEYISNGNQLMFQNLSDLKKAMEQTQSVLKLLNTAQYLKNQVNMPAPGYTAGNWAKSGFVVLGSKFNAHCAAQNYQNNTSSLKRRLLISVNPSFLQQLYTQGNALRQQLSLAVDSLNAINPAGMNDPNSLQSALQKVVVDMGNGGPGLINWLLDNEDETIPAGLPGAGTKLQVALAGNFQRNLTVAVTSAENLNSAQNIDLQSALFNFHQFYSSASALLGAINDVISNMETNIK